MLRKLLSTALVCLLAVGTAFAQSGSLSGTVTDAQSGETLPGANVVIQELQRGAPVNAQGKYSISDIPAGTYTVNVSFIGYNESSKTVEISAGETATLNFALQSGVNLGEVVVTALGQEQSESQISFSSQEVSSDQLDVAQETNIKSSLAGKVSGVQIVGQAGSKLGSFGNIRIRGAISLTDDLTEPLYVVDGVPVQNPNIINMDNVASVNVLKGPNATALYGQRGENGVIIISTKESAESGVSVELNDSYTYEEAFYLPNYQNKYGQGYLGSNGNPHNSGFTTFHYNPSFHVPYFKPLDGMKHVTTSYADESWGEPFKGQKYAPWYAWFPDSPYYGQTQSWEARPNNVRDFFDKGMTNKGGFAINAVGENYSARLSYSNLSKEGLIPYSSLDKNFMSGRFQYDVTDDFNVGVNVKYTLQKVRGDVRSDGYSNQTSGTFNQWFGRQVNVKRLKALQDLKTPAGTLTSWNWWGPDGVIPYSIGGTSPIGLAVKSPTFWFNAYKWMNDYKQVYDRNNLLMNVDLNYQINDQFELTLNSNVSQEDYQRYYEVPYIFQYSSDQTGQLYNHYVNSFGQRNRVETEYDYSGRLNYEGDFGDISVDAMGGGTIRVQNWNRMIAEMDQGNYQNGGLKIPNAYVYSNSKERIVPNQDSWDKRVYSLYAKATVGYKDYLYLDGSYRQDWSSALPSNNNGYGYPSVGLSFVFSDLIDFDALSYGKIRAGWAQVGDDVHAEDILTNYALSSTAFVNPATGGSQPLLYTDNVRVAPNIKPALNTSVEAGFDVRFFNDRIGLNATYYNEVRKDEIIPVSLSSSNGVDSYLTNAGKTEREGVELSLNGVPVQTQNFRWDLTINWATNQTIVKELPRNLDSFLVDNTRAAFGFVNIYQVKGEEWGQLRGTAIKRNDQGQPVVNPSTGLYKVEQNHDFGSVLPDWTGGVVNQFSYKNIGLTASIDYQKGGQFFSLTEHWGESSGLLKETAGTNDLGNPKRGQVYEYVQNGSGDWVVNTKTDQNGNTVPVMLPEADRGGVHVQGVTESGKNVDMYVPAVSYYGQWISNSVAEPFIHPADYIKLRAINLNYSLPKEWLGGFLNSATIGVVANNVWMIAVNPENTHGFDPSELAETYGENGQLPGTRSYGVNVKVTF